ncbi:MAG: HEAT repeat domain-containing protein [Planctomycetota bacterium]|jgi:HEAT repeat protein
MDADSKSKDIQHEESDNGLQAEDGMKNTELGEDIPGVTPEELRSAEFGNSVENVLFSRFLYEIGSSESATRSRAARGIGGISHALSVKALSAQYNRENVAQVRKECIKALANLEMDGVIEILKKGLKDKAPSVRLAALQGVYRQQGSDCIEDILEMLEDDNALVRCRAATCVGWIGDPEYAGKLLKRVEDESSPVRRAAVESLGVLGAVDYVPVLFERLADSDESVRNKALSALASVTGADLIRELPDDNESRNKLISSWREKWDDGTLIEENAEDESETMTAEKEEKTRTSKMSIEDILNREDIMNKLDEPVIKRTTAPSVEEYHELERLNKELLVKIKEYEYEATSRERSDYDMDGDSEEDFDAVSEDSVDIITIVRELEKELDSAFDLKDSLQTELDSTQEALEVEVSSRKELEAQVELLEAQADLASQLKEEIAFVKEDRNVLSRRLGEANSKLEQSVADHDMVVGQLNSAESNIRDLQREKVDLEAQVINLKDKVRDLADTTEAKRTLEAKVRDLSSRLKATDIAKNSLELELTKIAEIGRGLREENENLRNNLSESNIELTNLKSKLQDNEDEKHEILVEKDRLESELTSLANKYEASAKVLDAAKKSLKDIRSAALRTTEHFKDRYYKPGERRGKSDK